MVRPISNIVSQNLEANSSDVFKVQNPHALERRMGHCAKEVFGQNSLQLTCGCDGEQVYCGSDHCFVPD